MRVFIYQFLISLIIVIISISYGEQKGREDLIKELETNLSIQTKTHYLMCVPKPSKDILIYRKRT